MNGIEILIGLGLIFGFTLVFGLLTEGGFAGFLAWSVVFCGFVVYGGLLESWILILLTVLLIIVLYLERGKNRGL